MTGYVLSVDADLDLDDIWEYIARDNIDTADRWIVRLFDAFDAWDGLRAWGTLAKSSRSTRGINAPTGA